MNTIGKEEYLLQVKNAMLFHFSHKDIHTTLDDLNQIFESGKEDGKTEGEIYNEFGVPKEFIHGLLQDNHDRFMGRLFGSIFGALILCAFIIFAFCQRSQVLLCILAVIVPGFIWYLLGGSCLRKIRTESERSLKRFCFYHIITFLMIVAEQVFITLLNTSLNEVKPFGKGVYCVSSLLLDAAVIIAVGAIYSLYRGYYLSFGILILSCGMVCSLFIYMDYLMRFVDAGDSYIFGFLPYMVSFAFSVGCFLRYKQ